MGKDVSLFSAPHRVPHGDGLSGRRAPGTVIPNNPPDQPAVRSGDPVVLIHIQLSQRADINPEFSFCRNHPGKLLIQPVDTFCHQNILRPQLQKIAPVLSFSRMEIEIRQFYLVSF